jgi:hypothetical protein
LRKQLFKLKRKCDKITGIKTFKTQPFIGCVERQNCLPIGVARWFIFKPKNPTLGKFWEALEWDMFIYFMEYFTAIWYNLRPFGIVCGDLVYFSNFGMFGPRKIWQPCWRTG